MFGKGANFGGVVVVDDGGGMNVTSSSSSPLSISIGDSWVVVLVDSPIAVNVLLNPCSSSSP